MEIGFFLKGVLIGIMRICFNEEYFFYVIVEGKFLQFSRMDFYEFVFEFIGIILQRLMMMLYFVVYYKGSFFLVSDIKIVQREVKVI